VVFVLDKRKKPLVPCSKKRARLLLAREVRPLVVKIDPVSKTAGIAVVTDEGGNTPAKVLCLFELSHRGRQIREALTARRAFRRHRRGANLRHRARRFDNRTHAKSWLAPSLQRRVSTRMSRVSQLHRWVPVSTICVECVCFDTQALENPEILGVEYQPGTLAGYEVRVFEKFGRHCVDCGVSDVPFNLDPIHPRARGGSNRASNLVAAGIPCNTEKGARPIEEFLAGKPAALARITAQVRAALKDAVNTTRWALYEALADAGLPVEASSGGRTKYDRSRYPEEPRTRRRLCWRSRDARRLAATDPRNQGRGTRLLLPDQVGQIQLPARLLDAHQERVRGFKSSDVVRADGPTGARKGVHIGRVAVRESGSFNIGKAHHVNWKSSLFINADRYRFAVPASPVPVFGRTVFHPRPPATVASGGF
jgi:RRXRR protein